MVFNQQKIESQIQSIRQMGQTQTFRSFRQQSPDDNNDQIPAQLWHNKPYNCICSIYLSPNQQQINLEYLTFRGTGFVIYQGQFIIGAAHSLVKIKKSIKPEQRIFIYFADKQCIEIIRYKICSKYLQILSDLSLSELNKLQEVKTFDYFVGMLEKTASNSLNLQQRQIQKGLVDIFGYYQFPETTGLIRFGQTKSKILSNENGALKYTKNTKDGFSGAPIFQLEKPNPFNVIAIHRGLHLKDQIVVAGGGFLITQEILNDIDNMRRQMLKQDNQERYRNKIKWDTTYFFDYYQLTDPIPERSPYIILTKVKNNQNRIIPLSSQFSLQNNNIYRQRLSLSLTQSNIVYFGIFHSACQRKIYNGFGPYIDSMTSVLVNKTEIALNPQQNKIKISNQTYNEGSFISKQEPEFIQKNSQTQLEMQVQINLIEKYIQWIVGCYNCIINLSENQINNRFHIFVDVNFQKHLYLKEYQKISG